MIVVGLVVTAIASDALAAGQPAGSDVMNELAQLAWRAYPATALMAGGVFVIGLALRRCHDAWPRPLAETMQPLGWMRGFRLLILGLALTGIGAAWLWQIGWLLAVSLVVVAEETLETSIAIGALSSEHRSGTSPDEDAIGNSDALRSDRGAHAA